MDLLKKRITANRIIDKLGGTGLVANLFKISPSAICYWRNNGIPDDRMMYIELAYPALFKKEK